MLLELISSLDRATSPAGSRFERGLTIVLLAVVYFLAAKLGLALALIHPSATAVWPPTGIALAATVVYGSRLWPGIFLGAFFANVTTAGSVWTSLEIAAGNTLEAVVGAYGINRFAGGRSAFDKPQDVLKFAVLAGLATTVSATVGATSLYLGGLASSSVYWDVWFTWWLGDLAGALVLTPFLILCHSNRRRRDRRLAERALALSLLAVTGYLAFVAFPAESLRTFSIAFLSIPILLWTAVGFGRKEASAAVLLMSVIAIWGTVNGRGPFIRANPNDSLLLLQQFAGMIAVMIMTLSAAIWSRKRTEATLRETDKNTRTHLAELQTIYLTAPVGLGLTDRNLRFVNVNQALAEIDGISVADHIGRTVREILPGPLADIVEPLYRRVLVTGEPVVNLEVQGETQANPGVPRFWSVNYYPVHGGEEGIVGVSLMVQEITDRKRMEELQREADRRKDEFLAVLGHELRNPLGIISTAAQLMRTKAPPGTELQSLRETIEVEVRQLARLLDDLLDVSRIARGVIRLQKEPCDLTVVVRQVVEAHLVIFEQQGLELSLRLPNKPLWVMGDRTRLAQILGNLLYNAHKFTDSGGKIAVGVAEDPTAGAVLLTVRDTGIGMKAEMLSRVFEEFIQADNARERSRDGLGLGLALVKGLVELHGGEVSAESEGPGRGSLFTVRLFLTQERPPEAQAVEASGCATVARRILIIEDNLTAAQNLRTFLAESGHAVEIALNGPAGVAAARRFRPDVVLCDIGLPGLNGYAVAHALRQEIGLIGLYMVAVTGYGQDTDQKRALEAGFNAHLTKPIDLQEVERLLANLSDTVDPA